MPWGRIDDQHYRHEKVHELDEGLRKGCIALYWLTISWCNDRLTDGRVPAGIVRILGGDIAEADELVRVGLWERDGQGYRVHNYLRFNKSKVQVEEERVQRTLAGQAGAKARWHPDGEPPSGPDGDVPSDTDGEPNGGRDAPVSRTPSPVTPNPAPDARIAQGNDPFDEPELAAMVWLARHGCEIRPGNGYHQKLITAVEAHGIEAVLSELDRMASAGVHKGDVKGFLFGAIDALNARTRPNLRALEVEDRTAEIAADRHRRFAATQVRLHEQGSHELQASPSCPRCQEVAV